MRKSRISCHNQNLNTKTRIGCGPLRILRDWQPGIDTTKTKTHTEGLLIPVRIEYVVLSGDVWISLLEEEYLVVSISISASLRPFLLPFAINRQLQLALQRSDNVNVAAVSQRIENVLLWLYRGSIFIIWRACIRQITENVTSYTWVIGADRKY